MEWKRNNKKITVPINDYLESIIIEEVEKGYTLKVSIGTDSQKISGPKYNFVTVILISTFEDLGGGVIVGRGGIVISHTHMHTFKTKQTNRKLADKEIINERMVYEVGKSIEAAYSIASLLDSYGVKLEIHADINPNPTYDSNKALQHAVGYILGMGYDFKIKPDAYASSSCADKLC
jgi:predicted RNase H-related nuclease YkuK (DUF458 family)